MRRTHLDSGMRTGGRTVGASCHGHPGDAWGKLRQHSSGRRQGARRGDISSSATQKAGEQSVLRDVAPDAGLPNEEEAHIPCGAAWFRRSDRGYPEYDARRHRSGSALSFLHAGRRPPAGGFVPCHRPGFAMHRLRPDDFAPTVRPGAEASSAPGRSCPPRLIRAKGTRPLITNMVRDVKGVLVVLVNSLPSPFVSSEVETHGRRGANVSRLRSTRTGWEARPA